MGQYKIIGHDDHDEHDDDGGPAVPTLDDALHHRVAEAEHVLHDLATAGSPDAEALRLDPAGSTATALAVALDAVRHQAGLVAEAAARAAEPGWLVDTAPHWQRYLRWLLAVQQDVLIRVGHLEADVADALAGPLQQAEAACVHARVAWSDLVRATPARTELDSVVTSGRVYVAVDELADSLRERAAAFTRAARDAADAGDELGALVAEELADELTARADALTVASLEPGTG